jgi:hypothetical protein
MADDMDPMAKAFLDHQEMEETRAYLERGREFKGAPAEGIEEAWAVAFKLVYEYGESSHRDQLNDLAAELRLRGLEPPGHLVQETIGVLQERLRDTAEVARDSLLENVKSFLEQLEKPKN